MASNAITFTRKPALFAYNAITGTPVHVGDTVTDFRGETATVTTLSRATDLGRSGKVVVSQGDSQREYYDKVFDLVVTDVAPGEYDVFTLDGQGNGVVWARKVKAHNVIDQLAQAILHRGAWGGDYHPSK